ncbi:secretion/DNA translocation related TadE-like protein [Spinactinospora alkalitolerans]|uniref:Secretion/DNA translocation related TadE-like protein n=1 Tax=Spinactinospora alkalitolerans TaxID=687207 RepID=A0A852TNN5_9ACTN|nr:Rv3654c family TadE-like protein [Spinactinospora alkalitolerans]NYE44907.1 secretion/DNA translocation related TadE-like protein [Spinactinospora alkalitolerans]
MRSTFPPVRRLPAPRHRETGSGTVWVLVLCALIWFCAFTSVLVASVRTDRHRAAAAADLAALAGARQAARGSERACATAVKAAEANGARLTSCEVSGLTMDVRVRVPARMWPGTMAADARAGPLAPTAP